MSKLQVETISHTNNTTAMTIDTSGRVLKPATPHFHVTKNDAHVGASTTIVWNNKVRDTETSFNTSTGKYTIPLTGVWWMGICGLSNNTNLLEISVKVNDTLTFNVRNKASDVAVSTASTSFAYYFTASDVVSTHTQASSSMYGTGSAYAYWTGYLIG
mgnify:CR=1 FL=1|tara:strand:+ start:1083 stop:1556 length:474 start_codon:yes stop_codon:yes gene_type:complete